MSIGPFLRRELVTSVRGERAFGDRRLALILSGSSFLGCFLLWDHQGWDRSTILGAHRFGLATFGLMVASMMLLAFGIMVDQVASSIASERDRKTLDALLASRFSSAEIVLGAVAAGLFRYANALAGAVPVVALIVSLGGVAPAWAVLAGVGLSSTALLLAGFSVAASVGARTRPRAVVAASAWFGAWFALPAAYLMFRPFVWPGAPGWLTSGVVATLDGGPMGLLMNGLGVLPRPGGPIGAVGRMAAWQAALGMALVGWSIARLRPASRALHDVEGEQGRIRRLKAALRRPPGRPPCSDDPVFWREVHATGRVGLLRSVAARAINLAWLASLAAATWSLAAPAFGELARRGYGPSPEAFTMPELHPALRLVIRTRVPNFAADAGPGQARLEFNMMLRAFSGIYALAFVAAAFSGSFESLKAERKRDTWLGLIATPLAAREILRGKAVGTLWKIREVAYTLVALWTVGLLSGAIHPLGFLAALALLAASGAAFASLGILFALLECEHETKGRSPFTAIHLPPLMAASFQLTAGPMALSWACLFTYEDLDAAIRGGPLPQLVGRLGGWAGARSVAAAWLAGTAGLAIGAYRLDRRNARRFDEAIGRPIRPKGRGDAAPTAPEGKVAPASTTPAPLERLRTPGRP